MKHYSAQKRGVIGLAKQASGETGCFSGFLVVLIMMLNGDYGRRVFLHDTDLTGTVLITSIA